VIEQQAILFEQQKKLKAAEPKIEIYNNLVDATGLLGLQEAGKSIGLKPRAFIKKLRQHHYIWKRSDRALIPYQQYIDRGYFVVRNFAANGKARTQTRVTPKGRVYFYQKFVFKQFSLMALN